jgi:hypothetical protein
VRHDFIAMLELESLQGLVSHPILGLGYIRYFVKPIRIIFGDENGRH